MSDSANPLDAAAKPASLTPADPGVETKGFARNTVFNVLGLTAPIVLSLVTVPLYLHRIGEERYGVLAVVWGVLGYFAVFEFGLGRATTNRIARLGHDPARRERVFWTALFVNVCVGVLGGLVLLALGHALFDTLLKAPGEIRSEAVAALPWLSAAVPLTTASAVLTGALEGRERFLTLNVVIVLGLAIYQLAPLAYAYAVGPSLTGLIMVSTLALLVGAVVTLIAVAVMLPVRRRPGIDPSEMGSLFRYGGWVAISGLTGPFLTVVDRLIIGAVLGARNVARYTIPSALVTRGLLVAVGLARTLFPRLSSLEPSAARRVSGEALRALVVVMTPLVVVGIVVLEPFLRIWVGAGIADSGAPVGEILLLGVWMNSLAVVPYAFLQAQGRPDLTAKFHVLEVAPYLGGLWLGLHFEGLNGVAWAWTARAGVDALLLFWAAGRGHAGAASRSELRDILAGAVFVTAGCVSALTLFEKPAARIILGLLLVTTVLGWAWRLAPYQIRHLGRRTTAGTSGSRIKHQKR